MGKQLAALVVLVAIAGCAGEGPTSRDGFVYGDVGVTPDRGTAPDGPAATGCSAQGVAASCDPLTNSGCSAGAACYVIKDVGSACVCPAGTIEPGGDCATTIVCAPMHGCQGTTPPGKCVPYCDVNAAGCSDPDVACPQCPAEAARCVPITGFMQFAICKP